VGKKFQRVAFLPIGFAQRDKIPALGVAGVVNENVERAEFAPHCFDQLHRRILVAQIERGGGGAATLCADQRRHFIEGLFVTSGQHQVAAFGRQA
jgi:hypothetical protein